MTKLALPRVALIGRTNVGKSTLFNRIAKRTQSIVSDQEGVTRDFLTEPVEWNGKRFELIDTGGLAPMGSDDPFHDDIQAVGSKACQEASVLLFVCDARNGITMDDKNLARKLHELKKPILLLLNKADNKNALRENEADFYSLGFKGHYPVSATHGTGITPVLDQQLPDLAFFPMHVFLNNTNLARRNGYLPIVVVHHIIGSDTCTRAFFLRIPTIGIRRSVITSIIFVPRMSPPKNVSDFMIHQG